MHDLAKMFLHCLNHWKLETPTVKKQHSQGEDLTAYKTNYTRWVYTDIPVSLSSNVPGDNFQHFPAVTFDKLVQPQFIIHKWLLQ